MKIEQKMLNTDFSDVYLDSGSDIYVSLRKIGEIYSYMQ